MKTLYICLFLFISSSLLGQNIEFEEKVLNNPTKHKKILLSSFSLRETPKFQVQKNHSAFF